jgi:hypothetical protein
METYTKVMSHRPSCDTIPQQCDLSSAYKRGQTSRRRAVFGCPRDDTHNFSSKSAIREVKKNQKGLEVSGKHQILISVDDDWAKT